MIISHLKLDEEASINFDMKVYGTTEQVTDLRLVIESAAYDIVLKGKAENDIVKFDVPKLKGILESGDHRCRVEVIIDGKVFTPLAEEVSFEKLVECDIKKTDVQIKEHKISVQNAKTVNHTEKSASQNKVDEAKAAGYEIVEYAGYKILCEDKKYCGFVTDTKLIKADKTYPTIQELVESMTGAK